jgi:amino acid transporter
MASDAPAAQAKLGEKNLSTIHAVAQALAIGPMFSTALVLGPVSNPATGAGFNAALSVLFAGLGVLAIGYALTLFARRYAGAGAVYEYLTHGAHPSVGIFTAGVFFVGTLFLGGGGIYVGLGILANGFWAAHIGDASNAPAWWVFGAVALGIVLVLNYLGVRLAIRAMLTFAAISFAPMLLLAVVIIVKGGDSGNTLQVFNPGQTSLLGVTGGGVLGGILLGVLLFVGFEAAASIGEESGDPHRSIPRAVLGTVAASATFFVIMAYAISIGYGQTAVSEGKWALDPAALDTMATRYVGTWLATIIDLVVILDAMGLALAICVTIGRGYFALGRDGLLPSFFAKTSSRDTPWVGNLMVVVGGGFLLFVATATGWMDKFVPIFGSKEFSTFIVSATAGSFAIEFVYLMLAIVAFRLLMQDGGKPWQYLIVAVAVATPLLGFYGALHPGPHTTDNYNWLALYWALTVLVLAAIWFVVVQVTRPEQVKNAAAHAAAHRGVAPLDENLDYTPAPPDTAI